MLAIPLLSDSTGSRVLVQIENQFSSLGDRLGGCCRTAAGLQCLIRGTREMGMHNSQALEPIPLMGMASGPFLGAFSVGRMNGRNWGHQLAWQPQYLPLQAYAITHRLGKCERALCTKPYWHALCIPGSCVEISSLPELCASPKVLTLPCFFFWLCKPLGNSRDLQSTSHPICHLPKHSQDCTDKGDQLGLHAHFLFSPARKTVRRRGFCLQNGLPSGFSIIRQFMETTGDLLSSAVFAHCILSYEFFSSCIYHAYLRILKRAKRE